MQVLMEGKLSERWRKMQAMGEPYEGNEVDARKRLLAR